MKKFQYLSNGILIFDKLILTYYLTNGKSLHVSIFHILIYLPFLATIERDAISGKAFSLIATDVMLKM